MRARSPEPHLQGDISRFTSSLLGGVALSLLLAGVFRDDRPAALLFALAVICAVLAVSILVLGRRLNEAILFLTVPTLQLLLALLAWTTDADVYRVTELSFNIGIAAFTGWYFGTSRYRNTVFAAFLLGAVINSTAAVVSAQAVAHVAWSALLMGAVAVLVVISVSRLRRKEERATCRDSLTGALNRRGLERYMHENRVRSSRRKGVDSALVVFDIDEFKAVNDRDGHLAGDFLLEGFSQSWLQLTRIDDCFARIGGDEFLLILKGSSPADARRAVQRITAQSPIRFSYGITTLAPDEDVITAFARADHALYARKRSRKETDT